MITFTTVCSFVLPFYRRDLKRWITKVTGLHNKKTGDIAFIFCTDDYLLEINQKYLNHNTYTDIITFDYTEGNILNGDIFISIDRVKDNANKFGLPFELELKRVIIHGILHLCGLNDKTESEIAIMRKEEDVAVNNFCHIINPCSFK